MTITADPIAEALRFPGLPHPRGLEANVASQPAAVATMHTYDRVPATKGGVGHRSGSRCLLNLKAAGAEVRYPTVAQVIVSGSWCPCWTGADR
jgi:hypothetical protein